MQGRAKERALGCVNSPSAARGSQKAGFTQPRDHSFAQPCNRAEVYCAQNCEGYKSWFGVSDCLVNPQPRIVTLSADHSDFLCNKWLRSGIHSLLSRRNGGLHTYTPSTYGPKGPSRYASIHCDSDGPRASTSSPSCRRTRSNSSSVVTDY